jgi:hypothetical protein
MLFKSRFWPGIADGSITLTFRRWKRPQAVAGHVYRTPAGRIAVDAMAVVHAGTVSDDDARMAGFETAAALAAELPGDEALPIYRVAFHLLDEPDPRDELASAEALTADEIDQIRERLARWDSAGPGGPWALATLQLIAGQPGRRASDLAGVLGRDTREFKVDVRKLKALGLTISLETGYRLSPRGMAFLEALDAERSR